MTRTLAAVHRLLERRYGPPPPPPSSDPFELVLWEQVAYLVDDQRRRAAFDLLRRRVGTAPADIAAAPEKVLREIAASGSPIAVTERADRMRRSAELVLDRWQGVLRRVLELPMLRARRELAKFPMIGEPGAEKILLFTGAQPILALESNGVRVLLRLGYGREEKSYRATYRGVQAAAVPETRPEAEWLIAQHLLLRTHGQETCRRSAPACEVCPLTRICDYFQRTVRGRA
jgi:endonuclease III